MISILPRKEKLKKREFIIPICLVIWILLLLNGFLSHKGKSIENNMSILFTSILIPIHFIMPKFFRLIKIQFNRLYNTIIWFIVCLVYAIVGLMITSKDFGNLDTYKLLFLPLLIFGYYHIMRVVHLLLFRFEPFLSNRTKRNSYDSEEKRIITHGDYAYGLIYGLAGLILYISLIGFWIK